MIFGPAIHYSHVSGDELSNADVSTSMLYASLASGKDGKIPPTEFPLWGDVSEDSVMSVLITDRSVTLLRRYTPSLLRGLTVVSPSATVTLTISL